MNDVQSAMTAKFITLDLRSRREWRAWLKEHHASSQGIWLVFHKRHTSVESIPYEDAVREALCFGWIDSLVKRLDEDRYALKVTPRRTTSKWSDLNRRRWAELKGSIPHIDTTFLSQAVLTAGWTGWLPVPIRDLVLAAERIGDSRTAPGHFGIRAGFPEPFAATA